MSNRDLTITLKIKSLHVPVNEQMPVIVIWSRQSKQAKTKKRLLSANVDTTVFDEDFQITTNMACDADGTPTKAKMVRHNMIGTKNYINPYSFFSVVSNHSGQ